MSTSYHKSAAFELLLKLG